MKLQQKIDENCISINSLHKQSGVCRQTIRDILDGKRKPCNHTLSKLAKALGCTKEELKGD